MRNIAGSPVEGDNFFGRKADIARIKEALIDHDVLLLGPRRIGKTSVARAVMAEARKAKSRAIEFNVASSTNEQGFLEKLEEALRKELDAPGSDLWRSMTAGFTTFTTRIRSVKIPVPGAGSFGLDLGEAAAEDWTKVAGDILIRIAELQEPWLIYIDELPILVGPGAWTWSPRESWRGDRRSGSRS